MAAASSTSSSAVDAACRTSRNLQFLSQGVFGSRCMAQPSLKITEAFRGADEEHAGDAKLRGNSVSSRSSFDLLRRAGGVAGTRAQRGGADELAEARQRPAVLPQAGAALPPEGSAGLPRMPPG